MKLQDVKAGDRLIADDGFTCIPAGAVRVVRRDGDGSLFVKCRDGWHGLTGQIGENGDLIGFTKAESK